MQPTPADTHSPIAPEPVSPEMLAWARQTFDERECTEGVRDIEATGGRSFDALIAEVEALVRRGGFHRSPLLPRRRQN